MKFPSPEEVAAAKKRKENEIREAALLKAAADRETAKKAADEAAKKAREKLENDVLEHLKAEKLTIPVTRECKSAVNGVLAQLQAQGWVASYSGGKITVTENPLLKLAKLVKTLFR